jgi:hypothetical protein
MNVWVIVSLIFLNFYLFPGSGWSGMSGGLKVDAELKAPQQEQFPFTKLPLDIQKLITQYIWAAQDSDVEFRKQLLILNEDRKVGETSHAEGSFYGFHGIKTPIYFNTYKYNKSVITEPGIISQDSQSSLFNGLMRASSTPTTDRICWTEYKHSLKNHIVFNTRIKERNPSIRIIASALSVLGDLAIIWQDERKEENLTFLTLKQLCSEVDLDSNKIVLQSYSKGFVCCCLFNKQGTKLGIGCHLSWDADSPDYDIQQRLLFINVPSKAKELTPAQIMKRLMISQKIFNASSNNNAPQE